MKYHIYELNANGVPYKRITLRDWEEIGGGFSSIEDAKEALLKTNNPQIEIDADYTVIPVINVKKEKYV